MEIKGNFFVYITTNVISGKIYVGKKKSSHKDRNSYLGSGTMFKKALNKYGKDNFKREILVWADTQKEIDYWEIFYISLFSATNREVGYNIAPGGGGNTNPVSEETKRKLSEINKGKKQSPETIEKRVQTIKALNRKLSLELRQKLSKQLQGNSRSKISVRLTCMRSGEVKIFDVLKDASVYLGVNKAVLRRYLLGFREDKKTPKNKSLYSTHILKEFYVEYENGSRSKHLK